MMFARLTKSSSDLKIGTGDPTIDGVGIGWHVGIAGVDRLGGGVGAGGEVVLERVERERRSHCEGNGGEGEDNHVKLHFGGWLS